MSKRKAYLYGESEIMIETINASIAFEKSLNRPKAEIIDFKSPEKISRDSPKKKPKANR